MKTFGVIVKIVLALAAVAGAIYLLSAYGEKIVAWAKKVVVIDDGCCCCCKDDVVDAAAEEDPASEADFEG